MFKNVFVSLMVVSLLLVSPMGLLAAGKLVNLNTASLKEIVKLPGIGKQTAKRIMVYRTQHGPFTTLKDLAKVKGLGKKTLAKLAKLAVVNKTDKVAKLDKDKLEKFINDTDIKRIRERRRAAKKAKIAAKKAGKRILCKKCRAMVAKCKECKKIGGICKKCAAHIAKCKDCKRLNAKKAAKKATKKVVKK